jgi:phospholipid transport system substrate-binding protein
MRRKRLLAAALFCVFLAGGWIPQAAAQPEQGPLEALKGPIEEVLDILKDPRYNDNAHEEEQYDRLWAVVKNIFDFEAIARGTLTRYRWEQFTPAQREAFTDAFTEFLGNNYFNQIHGKYKNERVAFDEAVMRSDTKALVKTRILRESVEIPVDYSMWTRGGRWRIYNVTIEGASLLGNYRNEFERVLQNNSPDHLITTLREKTENLKSKKAAE